MVDTSTPQPLIDRAPIVVPAAGTTGAQVVVHHGLAWRIVYQGERWVPRGEAPPIVHGDVIRVTMTRDQHLRLTINPDAPNGLLATYARPDEASAVSIEDTEPDEWKPNVVTVDEAGAAVPLKPSHLVDGDTIGNPLASVARPFLRAVADIADQG